MQGCRSCTSPYVDAVSAAGASSPSNFPVKEALGALIWLSCTARADISFDTGVLARLIGKHGAIAGTASQTKRVLKYLALNPRRGLECRACSVLKVKSVTGRGVRELHADLPHASCEV